MTHNNALITNAMLASYAGEKGISYLQMIEPFIIYSLPSRAGKKVDISKVASNVHTEFGLDIKSKVVEKILLNLSKNDSESIVKYSIENKHSYAYYVNSNIDKTEFDYKRKYIKGIVIEVVERLKNYINNEENLVKRISSKDAETILINFLDNYNADVYKNINNAEKIQFQENISSYNYKVAKFILNEYNNELGCFDKIKQIQEGYFASIALYNFFEDVNNINKVYFLKETSIVLDTMLLADALKLDTEYKASSMDELILLINENGGILYTFDYYVDELCGIIGKYVSDPDVRISLDLDYYRRNKTSITEILLQLNNIKDDANTNSIVKLKNKDIVINILPSISYSELIAEGSWHIDYSKLETEIRNKIDYSSESAFKNDCETVQRILYEKVVNNNKFIFLSSNHNLIFAAKKFVEGENKNLFYTDIDLTSRIWLSNYNNNKRLSELALLQNAYAALSPTKEILNSVLKIIENNMNSSDEQLKKDALLLRYDENLLYHISSVIQNDKKNININTQKELMNSLKREIENDFENNLKTEIEQKYKEQAKRIKTDNYKSKKLKQKEDELHKREQSLLLREKELNTLYQSNVSMQKDLDSTQQELKHIKDTVKLRNNNIANYIANFIKYALLISFGVLIYIVIKTAIIFCASNFVDKNITNNIYQIASLISLIITIITVILGYINFSKRIAKKTKDKIYHFLCKSSTILNKKTP